MSPVQFLIEFSIVGQSLVGKATITRNMAPKTVALINYQLRKPIRSRVVVRDGEVVIPFKIGRAGPEKARKRVTRGEVAYWPQSQTLIIFLDNKQIDYPVNIIGSINAGSMKFFDTLSIGKSIRIEMIRPMIDEEDYL